MKTISTIPADELRPEIFRIARGGWAEPTAEEVYRVANDAGLDSLSISELLGVTRRTATRWLSGDVTIGYSDWAILCQYAGYPPFWDPRIAVGTQDTPEHYFPDYLSAEIRRSGVFGRMTLQDIASVFYSRRALTLPTGSEECDFVEPVSELDLRLLFGHSMYQELSARLNKLVSLEWFAKHHLSTRAQNALLKQGLINPERLKAYLSRNGDECWSKIQGIGAKTLRELQELSLSLDSQEP